MYFRALFLDVLIKLHGPFFETSNVKKFYLEAKNNRQSFNVL